MDKVKIIWYGERGVVNSLANDIQQGGIEAVKALLSTIRWCSGAQPTWIDQIQKTSFIVEIGLNDFGNPDLILVCYTDDSNPYVIFLEAKVITYLLSAMSNEKGMDKSFNSSINGQLSLKYRFAKTLQLWNGSNEGIVESNEIFQAYKRSPKDGGLDDTNTTPRKLKKAEVLKILRENNLQELPVENSYYVALTWDKNPFFTVPELNHSNFRPLFLLEDGSEIWNESSSRVGWLGYGEIEDSQNLKKFLGKEYEDALSSMVPSSIPRTVAQSKANNFPKVTTYRIKEKSNPEIIQTLASIEDLAKKCFGIQSVSSGKGSSSVKLFNKVLIKLYPQEPGSNEKLFIGISTSLGRPNWGNFQFKETVNIGVGDKAQPFYIYELPCNSKGVAIAEEIFELLAETLA